MEEEVVDVVSSGGGDNSRKELYRMLITDKNKSVSDRIKKYSFKQFEERLLNDTETQDKLANYLISTGKAEDPSDFTAKFLQVKQAPQPAPIQPQQPPAVSLAPPQRQSIEQQAAGQATGFVPPMAVQPEQPMQPDLGAKSGGLNLGRAFGGVAPVFQDEAQIKQEAQSPVFLANELAAQNIEGAAVSPTQQAVSASQRDFAKMSPEQQAQAIAGSTGSELERKKANEKRSGLQKIKDFGKTLGGIATNAYDAIIASEKLLGAKQRDLLTFGGAEENLKKVKQQVISSMGKIENEYAQELRDNNIETSLVDVINKGELSKLPEAIGYNVANAIVSGLGAAFTGGYSMFAQTLAQDYKSGVENLAKETNRTPEQVIADGDDAELIPAISATIQGLIEKAQIGLASKAINSKGAYKYIRDLVVKNTGNSKWAKAAGAGLGLGVASLESGAQGAAQEVASIASEEAAGSDSFNKFYNKLGKTLSSEAGQKRLTESLVGEAIGAGGLIAGGRFGSRILGERSPSAPPTQPPSAPPTQLGGIPTIPAPPNAPEFVPPVPPPSGATQTTYETVSPEELQAFQQGQIDPERAAAIADDVALIQSGQKDINSIDDANYRTMVEMALGAGKTQESAGVDGGGVNQTDKNDGLEPGERRIGGAIVKTGYVNAMGAQSSQPQVPQGQPPIPVPQFVADTPQGQPPIPVPQIGEAKPSFEEIISKPQNHIGEEVEIEINGGPQVVKIAKVGTDYVAVELPDGTKTSIDFYQWDQLKQPANATPQTENIVADQAAQNMGTAVNQPLETGAAAVEVGESGRPVVEVEGDQVVEEEKPLTKEQQITALRAKEQAEYDAMSDPNDQKKRKEIYDRYDKLISPLLPSQKNVKSSEKAVVKPKEQNFTQFAKENGYPDDYDTSFQAQLLGSRGLEGQRQSNRSIKEQDAALQEMQNKKAEGKKAYEQAILDGKVIDPDGKLTREGILKRDYDFNKKELESKIANAESGIKRIEGLGKMAHLDNGRLKKGYQGAVDDYNETIAKHKESLDKLKAEYEQSLKETPKAEAGSVGVGGKKDYEMSSSEYEAERQLSIPIFNKAKNIANKILNWSGTNGLYEKYLNSIGVKDKDGVYEDTSINDIDGYMKFLLKEKADFFTKEDYNTYLKYQDFMDRGINPDWSNHKTRVSIALSEGKKVPNEVLKEYPELSKEQSLKEAPKPKGKTEGFTEGKDLTKIFAASKAKYGEKEGAKYNDAANRLVNPNTNTIIEVRSNGVVVKEGGKYLLKPFINTDANYKKWELGKGLDVSKQFGVKEDGKNEEVGRAKSSNENNSTHPLFRDVDYPNSTEVENKFLEIAKRDKKTKDAIDAGVSNGLSEINAAYEYLSKYVANRIGGGANRFEQIKQEAVREVVEGTKQSPTKPVVEGSEKGSITSPLAPFQTKDKEGVKAAPKTNKIGGYEFTATPTLTEEDGLKVDKLSKGEADQIAMQIFVSDANKSTQEGVTNEGGGWYSFDTDSFGGKTLYNKETGEAVALSHKKGGRMGAVINDFIANNSRTQEQEVSLLEPFRTKGEEGQQARAELKERVGPAEYKRLENIAKNGEKILKDLQAKNVLKIDCP